VYSFFDAKRYLIDVALISVPPSGQPILLCSRAVSNSIQIRELLNNTELSRHLLRQHLIAYTLALADLTNATSFYMLQGTPAKLFYKVFLITVTHSLIKSELSAMFVAG